MRRSMVVAVLLGLVLSACGGETSVGEGLQTTFESASEDTRLGERTTPSPEPSPEATPSATPEPQPSTAPPPPPSDEPTVAPEPAVALEVSIYSDTQGPSQFDPSLARIYAGTCIRWVNVDEIARSVVADDGSFASGPLEPQAAFVHCFDTVGRTNYHDGTRPYAVAAVEVLAP